MIKLTTSSIRVKNVLLGVDHQNRRSVLAAAGFSGLMIFVIFCLGTCIKITHGLTLPVPHMHMSISGVIILRIMHAYMLAR